MRKVRNHRDVERALRKADLTWVECKGSHRKARLPDGKVLVYHTHGEYGKGIASKITKALVAGGVVGLLAAVASVMF